MKTYIKNNIESIKDYLNGLQDHDLVNTWNEYAREHDSDNEIFINDDDFFNTFFDGRVMDTVRAIAFGEYNYNDEFIKFNGYANLETTNRPEEWMDIDELAQSIMDNPQLFYDIELEDEDEDEATDAI